MQYREVSMLKEKRKKNNQITFYVSYNYEIFIFFLFLFSFFSFFFFLFNRPEESHHTKTYQVDLKVSSKKISKSSQVFLLRSSTLQYSLQLFKFSILFPPPIPLYNRRTHTHTHIYIYIYTYVCMYVISFVVQKATSTSCLKYCQKESTSFYLNKMNLSVCFTN